MLIARYTTNTSGVVPIFNDGYQYTVSETKNNGVYTVELNSEVDFTSCKFGGLTSLLTVEYLKVTSNVTNMNQMFSGCTNLTSLDVSNWDTSNVIIMSDMFFGCTNLTSLNVSNWDTSNVTYMNAMFNGCTNLTTLDVSNWDTSNVTRMDYMFNGCSQLTSLDVSKFNTSNVIIMNGMFNGCTNLTSLDVSGFNTVNVINMESMFNGCSNLTKIRLLNCDINTINKISGATIVDLYIDRGLDITNYTGANKLYGVKQEIKELPELHHGQEIVKIDGKYYIYHTHGKVVLDGSEDEVEWIFEGVNGSGITYKYTCVSTYRIMDMVYYDWYEIINTEHPNYVMCDKFKTLDITNNNWQNEVENVSLMDFGKIVFRINKTKLQTIDETGLRNYLQANPITVIYKLAEPYYEEITLDELMKIYIKPTNVKIKNASNIKINVKVVK